MAKPTGNKNGRPPLFDTPEEFDQTCHNYINDCLENGEIITVTGLALYLGFESRQSLYDYEKRDGFSYITKRWKLRIENEYEKLMLVSRNPTGPIFALKQMGWSDKQEIENSGEININVKEQLMS